MDPRIEKLGSAIKANHSAIAAALAKRDTDKAFGILADALTDEEWESLANTNLLQIIEAAKAHKAEILDALRESLREALKKITIGSIAEGLHELASAEWK